MDDEFYDLCYEAWRRGRNPDDVSMDQYDSARAKGYCPEEITLEIVLPVSKTEERPAIEGES